MGIDNAISQEIFQVMEKERFFTRAMEESWIFVWGNSELS